MLPRNVMQMTRLVSGEAGAVSAAPAVGQLLQLHVFERVLLWQTLLTHTEAELGTLSLQQALRAGACNT